MSITDFIEQINRESEKYGKLWPLQSINACNPLLAYEHLPFESALRQAHQDLGFSLEQSLNVLSTLYQKEAMNQADLETVVSKLEHPILEETVTVAGHSITYRNVLIRELIERLQGTAAQLDASAYWPKEIQKKLNQTLSQEQKAIKPSVNRHKMNWINEHVTRWLAAYLDDGQAIWAMPHQKKGFREAWRRLVIHDGSLSKPVKANLKRLLEQHVNPQSNACESLLNLFRERQLSAGEQKNLITDHLGEMPGWVGYIRYSQSAKDVCPELLYDYLLIRLLYDVASEAMQWSSEDEASTTANQRQEQVQLRLTRLHQTALFQNSSKEDFAGMILDRLPTWMAYFEAIDEAQMVLLSMEALELSQIQPLAATVTQTLLASSPEAFRAEPDAQAVFCIDVRSEPYRKALEAAGNIETYGFAGFFGLPIEKVAYTAAEPVAQCPILVEPKYTIRESVSPFMADNPISVLLRKSVPLREEWMYSLKKIKRDTFATFSYVESFGILHAFSMLRDTFSSRQLGKLTKKLKALTLPLLGLSPRLEIETPLGVQDRVSGIALPEQMELAKNILKLMGLKQPYAEFIIICGHTARARNNLYASALDCGACGGNSGGFNALVLCQILNDPDIREALTLNGIAIPEHTRFIAAEHNTTNDEVEFLNLDVIPAQQQQRFLAIKESFEIATALNSQSRQEALKTHARVSYTSHPLSTSYDWSQTRPEWGLSKNQAFIIGNRNELKSLDLQGRCFLHSYDWANDKDGSILNAIMTAPMVVGSLINLQYCFSTLDQNRFGSGKKYLHNAVGLFGAYMGNSSDLQIGLPYESLFANDGSPYHYPQRLMVYIQAPLERVAQVIETNPAVKNLVENHWLNLMVFDPERKTVHQFSQKGWQNLDTTAWRPNTETAKAN